MIRMNFYVHLWKLKVLYESLRLLRELNIHNTISVLDYNGRLTLCATMSLVRTTFFFAEKRNHNGAKKCNWARQHLWFRQKKIANCCVNCKSASRWQIKLICEKRDQTKFGQKSRKSFAGLKTYSEKELHLDWLSIVFFILSTQKN